MTDDPNVPDLPNGAGSAGAAAGAGRGAGAAISPAAEREAARLARDFAVMAAYPDLFGPPPPRGLMTDGFLVGEGWVPLVVDLLKEIRPLVSEAGKPSFRIHQIKEKIAGLRVYVSPSIPAVHEAIDRAEARAWRTCEQCGTPGEVRSSRPYLQTLCDVCEAEAQRREEDAGLGTLPPRDFAIERGVVIARDLLLRAGGTYALEQVQDILGGVPREAVEAMLREGRLTAVPGPEGEPLFPACQFEADGSPLSGLSELQVALPTGLSGWGVLDLLLNPHDALGGRRPLDLLRTGSAKDRRLVMQATRGMGVQGA